MARHFAPEIPDPAMMSDSELLEEARQRYRYVERDLAFLRIIAQRRPALARRLAPVIAFRDGERLDLLAAVWALLGEAGEPE